MDQELFQYFESLSQPSPVGEWYTSPVVSSEMPSSTHSSPDIATPLDVHLSPAVKLESLMALPTVAPVVPVTQPALVTDLDMSEILNSPIFSSSPIVGTPAMTPAMTPQADMFTELPQDLPAALAAFVAAVSTVSPAPVEHVAPATPLPEAPSVDLASFVASKISRSASSTSTASSASSSSGRKRSSAQVDLSADEIAVKRQKNTDAARRSRLKKVMKMEGLEKRVNDLERLNSQLLLRVAVLDSEKSHLKSKESAHEDRIKTLELQLAEAHRALASR
ncbi:hypothetical protein DM01DRAFT_1371184 [Hesseltinella vesiculosa]|uniref:BZIP domain-containing protein n=1 Tax=Hesseltinella vesiculosa TaxID=101127 RepID=A0A1X2GT91_9FUNG|nr:hypothetical protein DM01DRAFT_1371184 [Hesseltinella vesiculosa]